MPDKNKQQRAMPVPRMSVPQSAAIRMRLGKSIRFAARVEVTPTGILAMGALVSAILLSVAPILLAAGRNRAVASRARLTRIEN